MVYIGSSLATYGIGTIADHFGWSTLLVVLIAVASIGCVLCLAAIKPWKAFVPT
jgi:sugar phosphate permease